MTGVNNLCRTLISDFNRSSEWESELQKHHRKLFKPERKLEIKLGEDFIAEIVHGIVPRTSASMSGITALGLGPVLDWTLDNGLLQRFQVWKRKVNIIFILSISQRISRD